MTRKEYMDLLSRALENTEPEVARDIMEDYEAHFERARESGRSDEEVIAELGSIEEFKEELAAFMTGKNSAEKKNVTLETTVENSGMEHITDTLEKGTPQTENSTEEQTVKYQEQVEEELSRARSEMNRAYEEMMRARQELERATQETERVKELQKAVWESKEQEREEQRAAQESKKQAKWETENERAEREKQRTYSQNHDFDNIINSAKNIASTVLGQVSGVMDKAFSGFNDWVGNFEKSGEDMTDYRRRQENAKSEAESYQKEGTKQKEDFFGYSFSDDYNNTYDSDEEQYMPECNGIVTEEEGIRHIIVDSKSADVEIYPSKDSTFAYHYVNEGSAESRILYRCERKVSQNTLTLNIVRDEKVIRKNHSSILGGVFGENPDLRLELYLPKWVEALEVSGKSGEIKMENTSIYTLMLKSISGDISLFQVNADKCMITSVSGEVNIKDGTFDSVLVSSKSGDANGIRMKAEKAAFKSMSGEAKIKEVKFGEAVVSSMSGDVEAYSSKGKVINVSSMSGDARIQGLFVTDAKVSSKSGDVEAEAVTSDHLLLTTISGDLEGKELLAKILKASVVSGDMSIRGHADQLSLSTGSGDVVVVQEEDTKARVNTRSGEVHFHLKNNGAGFASKVSTHGNTNYSYGDLHLTEAANGIHRYGKEGSSLEIQSISGDITITD